MEIKYKNTIEDVEIFCNYFSEKFLKGSLYIEKFLLVAIPFFSGIYYSNVENTSLYFFTNSVVMTIIVIYMIFKLEPKFKRNVAKKQAIKMFNKNKYFSNEKTLSIDNESIIVKYDNDSLEIKLNKGIVLDVLDKYIIIIATRKIGYERNLIIPINVFNSEEEKNEFIEKIESIIL